jgi:hypothetical protein
MPDLITHTAVAHLIRRPFESGNPPDDPAPMRILFLVGVMLPDLMSRPWYILSPAVHDWVVAFHTPAGMLISCMAASLLFERCLRRKAFLWLSIGAGLHFAADGFQKQVTGNNFWLFPFSWKSFGIGLFWAGDAIQFVPAWIVLVLCMEFYLHWRKSNRIRRMNEGADRKFS